MIITRFIGEYEFLSNFYPCDIYLDGVLYSSVEHAYQAAKTLDKEQRKIVQGCATPGQAKRAGRQLVLRPDWEEIKVLVMRDKLLQKFEWTPLETKLLATGDATLVEGNAWNDTFWGATIYRNRIDGLNILGRLLMEVRLNLLFNKDRSFYQRIVM